MIIITTLAEYQTRFWMKVGVKLQAAGQDVAFLSFDDRSSELLTSSGLKSFNIPALAKGADLARFKNNQEALQFYDIDDINFWLSHERITFALRDSDDMVCRLLRYVVAIDDLLSEFNRNCKDVVMIQELGGFISVIAAFFAAQKNDVNNVFLEPSFFKGRFFPLVNSFSAPIVTNSRDLSVSKEVREIISSTIDEQTIVIPKKDAHQYRGAVRKVVNIANARRLAEKAFDKYVLGKHQEFGYPFQYVWLHLKMLLNSCVMWFNYSSIESNVDFVYFPLHVPGDMALTLRSPEYFDQLSLVEFLLKVIPRDHVLAVKEHPAQIGGLSSLRLKMLLKLYDNLIIINPRVNNYDVLKKANLVVSINSKSGAEAAMLRKPSLVLGDAFYKESPLVEKVTSPRDLQKKIKDMLAAWEPRSETVRDIYFQNVWDVTYAGELYVESAAEIERFTSSIIKISTGLISSP